jgi:hypothetical protein
MGSTWGEGPAVRGKLHVVLRYLKSTEGPLRKATHSALSLLEPAACARATRPVSALLFHLERVGPG